MIMSINKKDLDNIKKEAARAMLNLKTTAVGTQYKLSMLDISNLLRHWNVPKSLTKQDLEKSRIDNLEVLQDWIEDSSWSFDMDMKSDEEEVQEGLDELTPKEEKFIEENMDKIAKFAKQLDQPFQVFNELTKYLKESNEINKFRQSGRFDEIRRTFEEKAKEEVKPKAKANVPDVKSKVEVKAKAETPEVKADVQPKKEVKIEKAMQVQHTQAPPKQVTPKMPFKAPLPQEKTRRQAMGHGSEIDTKRGFDSLRNFHQREIERAKPTGKGAGKENSPKVKDEKDKTIPRSNKELSNPTKKK